jgi:RNA 3'-terminal phosphate cyclase (ATP)
VITIDGAQMSGSGTIVRYAVALAALRGESIRVINARQRRRQPGLRPQHVTGVHACAELCGATVERTPRDGNHRELIPVAAPLRRAGGAT